ncbi:MAG: YigZ family protein, partial [Bacillota bacterium]
MKRGTPMNAYKTLRKSAETEYVVQKSRFIGHAAPVSDANGALLCLETVRQAPRGASHNCFAYIVGRNKGIIRYSDDGEPSGTAGKPIVEVMTAKDVVDCIVVITRYFGGILLGTGGLVRAYAHTASLALDAAGICAMHETVRWQVSVAYPLWDRVENAVKSLPVAVESTEYADFVRLILLCRVSDEEPVIRGLRQITDGKIKAVREELPFFHP